jgi:catechol 2,3-dioxygenase-like lactoylglutathione lyase family enzyme
MVLTPEKDSVDVLIVVSDIKRSLHFYEGTLGLVKTQVVQTPFGNVHRLRYGTSLIKIMDPTHVPPPAPIGLEKQLGIRCVSFVVRGLADVCATLKAQGVEFTVAETQVLPDTRIAMVKDPDGNIIEFVEHTVQAALDQ